MSKKLLALSLVSFSTLGYAQELDPILLSNKQENPQSKMTSSTYVLEQQDIENQGDFRAVDILRRIPGVEVVQTGIVGGLSSVFIRGAESRHTVIMIDGVKVYDPTAPARSFNLSVLNTLDIERVEVMKGAQSVLYGSDAIGGVINLITKKGEGKNRLKAGVGIAKQIAAGHTFDFNKGLVYVSGYYQDSDFDSDASQKNVEDLKVNKGISATGIFQIEKIESETTLKITSDYAEVDTLDNNSVPVDSIYSYSKTFHTFFKQGFKYNFSDYEKVFLDYSYSRFERADNSGSGANEKDGSVMTTELRYLREMNYSSLVAGFSRTGETYRDDFTNQEEMSLTEVFGNNTVQYGSYILESGGRFTHNANFGSHIVYNLGARYNLSAEHSFKTSFKTGFQAPSLFQLFGETASGEVGNKDLAPEKSKNFEMGYDFNSNDLQAGVAFFQNNIEDFIEFRNSTYSNIEEAKVTGVDTYANWNFTETQTVGTSLGLYSYDLSTGREVARRPKQSFRASYGYLLTDEHSLGGSLTHQGERFDYHGDVKKTMDAYQVVDINYTFTRGDLKLMGMIKNIFNTDYEVAAGYNTLRRGVQINVEYIY